MKGVTLDNRYGICFRLFLTQLSNMFERSLKGVELYVVLEDGDPGIGDADRVFKSFRKFSSPELRDMVKLVGRAEKKDFYGLQIADWVAFGSYVAEQGTPDLTFYPKDATLQEATALVPYGAPVFRWQMTPEVLKDMKQRLIDHADHRREYWFGNRRKD